jgi:hypothetical protein
MEDGARVHVVLLKNREVPSLAPTCTSFALALRTVAMASAKPTIALIHSALHFLLYYAGLINPLRTKGFTIIASELPTTGSDPAANAGKTMWVV